MNEYSEGVRGYGQPPHKPSLNQDDPMISLCRPRNSTYYAWELVFRTPGRDTKQRLSDDEGKSDVSVVIGRISNETLVICK